MKRFLPLFVFAFFIACFALHPQSPFATHHLADPDDYMRLHQVANWLQGQGWYDLSVPRLSPGAGTIVHWARLLDVPLALVAWPFKFSFGLTNALLIAALLVPLIYFALLLKLLAAHEMILTKNAVPLSCVLLLFAPMLLFNYTPGRVDHHGVQALIAGFGLFSLTRIILDNRGALYAAMAAFFYACGFWIGAEALPWAILMIACLGCAAAFQGQRVARNAALFGACLPLFTALLLPIVLPLAQMSSRALSWFSPAYLIFAALAGGVLMIVWGASRVTEARMLRLALFAALGFTTMLGFFALIPSALSGPFTDYDTFDATTALDNITEAMPLRLSLRVNRFMPVTFIPALLCFMRLLFLPTVGLLAAFCAARQAQGARRGVWLAHGLFLAVAMALTIFWQRRVGMFMELFMLPPLGWLLAALARRLRWYLRDRPLFWAEIGAFAALGLIPVVILPALVTHAPFYPDLLLFPAARAAPACALPPAIDALNDPVGLGAKPHTIMNISDSSPELLLTTRHSFIAGNFDVPGNADAFAFFNAVTDAPARAIARKWQADLVLLCRAAPSLYLGKDYTSLAHTRLQAGKDGLLRRVNIDPQQPLIERLIRGDIPGWLKPIEIPGGSDYLLFQIQDFEAKK